jgi:hypothetical protein
METEDRFVPQFLSQDPNRDATYISTLCEDWAGVIFALKEELGAGASNPEKQRVLRELMQAHGGAGAFVDFRLRDPALFTGYEVKRGEAEKLKSRKSKYYMYLLTKE